VEPRKVEALSPEQTKALLQAIQGNRLTALFMVMFGLGLRRGEALGLHWQDVNLDSRKVRIRTILQRFNQAFVLGEPKTSKSRRKLSITVSVVAALWEWRAKERQEQLKAGADWQNAEGLVFTTEIGCPIDPRNVKRVLDRLLTTAGLPHCRIHDLRHFYASALLRALN
jgi:integrase